MAGQKRGLEGKECEKEELSLHAGSDAGAGEQRQTQRPAPARRRMGGRRGSARTEIGAARNLSPCLAVRSGSTNAARAPGEDALFFLLQSREHRDGLTSAPRARLVSAFLPVPDPQASQDLRTAHVGFARARCRNNSRPEQALLPHT